MTHTRISILHPSYGRPSMAIDAHRQWMSACDTPEDVQYMVGLDDNDPDVDTYLKVFADTPAIVNVGPSRNVVQATNRMALSMPSTTELIVVVGDDHQPCPHWDTELLSLISGVDPHSTIRFIGVEDGRVIGDDYQWLIVTIAWYTQLGYILCPEYKFYGADSDFNLLAKSMDVVIHAPSHLLFRHLHHDLGTAVYDATYQRWDKPEEYREALAILTARRARNFDIKQIII